jgi:hypothetical protein
VIIAIGMGGSMLTSWRLKIKAAEPGQSNIEDEAARDVWPLRAHEFLR